MSNFLTPLRVEQVNGKQWKILEPFEYYTNTHGILKGDIIEVPVGFLTDFASIPKIFYSIIGGPTGKYTKAAVVHDFCYNKQMFSRKRTDGIFLEAMKVLGVSWWKRTLMYYAVRVGGALIWRHHAKELRNAQ